MARIEQDTIKGMLQGLKHLLDEVDRTSTVAVILVNAQKAAKPLSPATLAHYGKQLTELDRQREDMHSVIARLWTLVEEPQ